MTTGRKDTSHNIYAYCKLLQNTGSDNLAHTLRQKRFQNCKNLYKRDLIAHFGCVNALEFSKKNKEYLASGGDDKRVLLWNVGETLMNPNYKPTAMETLHISNIFCLDFTADNQYLLSSGNDEQVIVHDIETRQESCAYMKEKSIFAISAHPELPTLFLTASEDGKVSLTDMRMSNTNCMADYSSALHGVMFNPTEPMLFASANSNEGAALWDIRKPKTALLRYGFPFYKERTMSVHFNKTGSLLSVLRRKRPVRIYRTHSVMPVCDFKATGYLNSCTVKSNCFAGENDEYVVSGSDDFQVYLWKIPEEIDQNKFLVEEEPSMVLKGHRSIVNQVRYNPNAQVLVSSGVEKSIKLWTSFRAPQSNGCIGRASDDVVRSLYNRNEYLRLVLETGSPLAHDYAFEDTVEDPRMMAFFDSLLQHDMDLDIASESSDDSIDDAMQEIVQELDSPIILSDNEGEIDYLGVQAKICRLFIQAKTETPISTWKNIPHLKKLLGICKRMADVEIPLVELQQFLKSYEEERSKVESNCEAGPSNEQALKATTSENSTEMGVSANNQGISDKQEHCVKFQKVSNHCKKRNASSWKWKQRTISSDEDSAGSDFDSKSNLRQRNAQRKHKVKKWNPDPETSDTSTKSKNSYCENSHENTALDRLSNCTAHEDQPSNSNSAYQRSAEKLNRSIEATNNRIASVAEAMAQALEDSENDRDNNYNDQSVS
ncbi:DDB1- and CUL4-associated factor 5 [Ciona intestinalis]